MREYVALILSPILLLLGFDSSDYWLQFLVGGILFRPVILML